MLKGNRDWPGWYLEGLETFFRDIHPFIYPVAKKYPNASWNHRNYVYEDVFESALFPLQRRQELQLMLQTSQRLSNPEVVMEIGADKGGGLYHWCLLPNVRRVIAIEIGGIPYNEYFERAFPSIEFLWIPGSSYDMKNVNKVFKWLGEDKIDALFIDGDKANFERDFRTYRPMLSPRSITFLHDLYDEGPKQAFERLSKEYPHVRLLNTEDSVRACVNEILGKPIDGRQDQWLRTWKGSSAGVGVLFTGKDYYDN